MGLTNEHVGPKILAKIKIYILTREELLINLCYEIPCIIKTKLFLKRVTLENSSNSANKAFAFLQVRLVVIHRSNNGVASL